jgi:hypothetical protein
MDAGFVGAELPFVTVNVLVVLLPQPLFAFTAMTPLVVPVVKVIEVVVEVPDQPAGYVQV